MSSMERLPTPSLVVLFLSMAVGCSDAAEVEDFVIPFTARVGERVVECRQAYDGVGRTGSQLELQELTAYVHDVELLLSDGERTPVELVDDGRWQGQGIALLDFDDGTGGCTASAETNRELRARAPGLDDAVGLAFRIGVPPELNHLDASTVQPPLDDPAAWWGWKAGYVFLQLTITTPGHDFYYAHVGSTECDGSVGEGFSCADDHLIDVRLDEFEPGRDGVTMDLGALLSGVDVDAPVDTEAGDSVPGCMSTPLDAECVPIFAALGRDFDSGGPGASQVVFTRDPDAGLDP